MENEILEEIINLSLKDKYITKELIEKIIIKTVEGSDEITRNKLDSISFCNILWDHNVMCTCNIKNGNISVDYEKIISQFEKVRKLNMLAKNLRIVTYLLHEVNHLKEESKIKQLNIESLLLSYSSFDILKPLAASKMKYIKYLFDDGLYKILTEKKQDKLYIKNYDKIPCERIANIYSYKDLFDSICKYPNFKHDYPNTFKYINFAYLDQYYLGYDKKINKDKIYKGPLLDYLKFIKMPNLLETFDFYCEDIKTFSNKTSREFSIEEKMLYGFPVTIEETDNLDKKLILSK